MVKFKDIKPGRIIKWKLDDSYGIYLISKVCEGKVYGMTLKSHNHYEPLFLVTELSFGPYNLFECTFLY